MIERIMVALRRRRAEFHARFEDAERELALRRLETDELERLARRLRIESESFVRRRRIEGRHG